MNAIIIGSYIWSVFILLEITNKRIYEHYHKTLRTGAMGTKFQHLYCYKIYTPMKILLRVLVNTCYFIYCFIGLVYLAKYIWTHI